MPVLAEVPIERYLAAVDHSLRMPKYSSDLGRGQSAKAAPSGQGTSSIPATKRDLGPGDRPTNTSTSASLSLGAWDRLGPGNVGGRIRALLINPTNPSIMYAGGVAGGVWKSTDAGGTWTPLGDAFANLAIASLAFDPANPNVIYAGTGEGVFNLDAVRGLGIFKSTDAGETWTHLPNTAVAGDAAFRYVNDIVVSANASARVYAATRTGIWRSLNGGLDWTQVLDKTSVDGCMDLVARTDQATDWVFATCGGAGSAPGFTSTAEVYRNTDAGGTGTWTSVFTETSLARTSLALAPSDQSIIYAVGATRATGTYMNGLQAVFRSTTGGGSGTWSARVRNSSATKLNTILLTNPLEAYRTDCAFPGTSQFFNQGWYDVSVAVDPVDPQRVWVGGVDLFRSDDGGANWGMASHWWATPGAGTRYAHADQHVIAFHPGFDGVGNQKLYAGNDGGIFRTDNARAAVATGALAPCDPANTNVTWNSLNANFGVTQFYHGLPYPSGTTFFGGAQDNGTVRGTTAGGVNGWTSLYGGDGGYVAIDPADTQKLYWETQSDAGKPQIYKSTTGGGNPVLSVTGMQEANALFIPPIAMDPGSAGRLWTGGWYLERTIDGAGNWQRASAVTAGSQNSKVSAIAVSPTSGDVVLAGLSEGYIHRTTAGLTSTGTTVWPFVQPRTGWVSWITFQPGSSTVAYATYSTFGGSHVWKTTDGGASWSPIDGTGATAIPDIPVHVIVVDPSVSSRLYVGTDIGVYVSLDGGATWAQEVTGFGNIVTESLAFATVGGTPDLFAFTHGRGAWRVDTAAPVVTQGAILFASDRDGDNEIYVRDDNSSLTKLTNNTWDDINPAWSRDATRVTFSSNRDGDYDIYVMNADGSNVVQVTNAASFDQFPSWSPDGLQLTFVSGRDGNSEIYRANANGTGTATRLTNNAAADFGSKLVARWRQHHFSHRPRRQQRDLQDGLGHGYQPNQPNCQCGC